MNARTLGTLPFLVFCKIIEKYEKIFVKVKFSSCMTRMVRSDAVTRIRTWVVAATTRSTNHYTIRAKYSELILILIIKTLFQEATHLTTRPA